MMKNQKHLNLNFPFLFQFRIFPFNQKSYQNSADNQYEKHQKAQ